MNEYKEMLDKVAKSKGNTYAELLARNQMTSHIQFKNHSMKLNTSDTASVAYSARSIKNAIGSKKK